MLTRLVGMLGEPFDGLRGKCDTFAAAEFDDGCEITGHYALLALRGRTPPWGIGVTSLILETAIPSVVKARMADSRPAPTPLTSTSTRPRPYSFAPSAARSAAVWAA